VTVAIISSFPCDNQKTFKHRLQINKTRRTVFTLRENLGLLHINKTRRTVFTLRDNLGLLQINKTRRTVFTLRENLGLLPCLLVGFVLLILLSSFCVLFV
jgi:hypothetical protein